MISQEMGLRLADYVVNEAGFGSDLGAEKYFDIVMQQSGIQPSCAVLVTTVQGIQYQGEENFERGLANFLRHIDILKEFGAPVIVAINRFPSDPENELKRLADYCAEVGVESAMSEGFTKGAAGSKNLAEAVVRAIAANPSPPVHPVYSLQEALTEKVRRVAQKVYGATDVSFTDQAKAKLEQFADWGYTKLPVCIAKTQYSLSDDPKLLGAPTGWTLNITDASLSAGAGFVVLIAGNLMLMPGLPKVPRALSIDVDESGDPVGI